MPQPDDWLSLQILKKAATDKRPQTKSIIVRVPKKYVRGAVARNRLKRQIREAARRINFYQDVKNLYLFQLKKNPVTVNFEKIVQTLAHLSSKK